MNENKSDTATESNSAPSKLTTQRAISASSKAVTTEPAEATRSLTPNRKLFFTSGSGRSTSKSYSLGRFCRPISITSSNPAVVTSATRAPLRSNSAFVPTVVPCSSTKSRSPTACRTACSIATDASCGVENTFSVRSSPPSTHTQSVNVPPVSTATRIVCLFNQQDSFTSALTASTPAHPPHPGPLPGSRSPDAPPRSSRGSPTSSSRSRSSQTRSAHRGSTDTGQPDCWCSDTPQTRSQSAARRCASPSPPQTASPHRSARRSNLPADTAAGPSAPPHPSAPPLPPAGCPRSPDTV